MKQQLGHYQVVAELGRGGMGVVYKGYETSLNRYVAIKVLADALAHDESIKERFLREARSMASLNDPHIIQIYYIGDDAGQTYFVMEFVDGESLGSLLKRQGKLTPAQAMQLIYQTAQGLGTAHDRGVIHRDIKPGNLMITNRGNVKIADFGIALSTQDLSKKLTSTGEFVGTPGYLSPEVCQGNPVDQRSDIFSLGIVLFECLIGRMPFTDESPLGLMLEVVKAEIPDVCSLNAEVDPELSRILRKMVAKDPADRYQSCQELCDDLVKHPLVAKGGPVAVQTQLSPAAATVVGQTPASAQKSFAATTPLPKSPTPPTNQNPAAAADPVLTKRPRTALPWAIAAIALLAMVGGAYAFRNSIPMLKPLFASVDKVEVADNAPASTAALSAQPVPPAPPAVPTAPTAPAPGGAVVPRETGATQTTVAAGATATTGGEQAASASGQASAAAKPAATSAEAVASNVAQTTPSPAATETANPERQMAKAESPAPVSKPRPHIPTVAILAGGDSAVSAPAQEMIANMLSDHGFRVVDQDTVPGANRFLRGARPGFADALGVLARGHVDAVVFVHARAVGTQELTYYGQTSTLYTAQLGVRIYDVNARRRLGRAWSEQVNFTNLNANQKAQEAVRPLLREVEAQLADYRPRSRRQ